jgi:ATP-binding cassette subfamily B protein
MAKNAYEFGSVNMNRRRGGHGMRVAEKPHDFKAAWKSVYYFGKDKKGLFILAIICTVASISLLLLGPNRLKNITDLISAGMESGALDTGAILSLSIVTGAYYVLSGVLVYTRAFSMTNVTQYIMHQMRKGIDHKINEVPLSRFDSASFGDLLSRVTNDVDTVGMSLNNALPQMLGAIIQILGSGILMLSANLILGFTALGASIIGFVGMNLIIRISQKHFVARQVYLGRINGHVEETFAGHDIVKAYNGEEEALAVFDELNEKLYTSNLMSQFLSGIMNPLMTLVGNIGYVAVCVEGAILTARGDISFGVIVAFIIYVKLFTQPLSMVAQSITELQSAAAAAERIFGFLEEPQMEDESGKTAFIDPKGAVKGRVEFSHVRFGYEPGRTIIKDFSATIEPGKKVAIVGPTGAGKTTIVNLLMRFYELDGGYISIDGVKTSELTRENVHDLFCMVLQDSWLFEGTIKENIVYSMKDVPDERVIEACKAVGLHRYIMSLPKGYDTVLTDDSNMSAGQRQLMTIARAMIKNAPLLILDEATSSVDTRTEQLVQNAMEKLTEGRTSFTIAHRLSTIRESDIILVMKDGDIVETGNHEELLARGGFYWQLWNAQFVNAEAI